MCAPWGVKHTTVEPLTVDTFYVVDTGLGPNCYNVYKSTSEIRTPLYTGHFL